MIKTVVLGAVGLAVVVVLSAVCGPDVSRLAAGFVAAYIVGRTVVGVCVGK